MIAVRKHRAFAAACEARHAATCVLTLLVIVSGCRPEVRLDDLAVEFTGRRGQLQVGGPHVGLEFHHSRPVPSRISFYNPVANSIDLSTDYWFRDRSQPVSVTVTSNGHTDTLGTRSVDYRSTPGSVVFEDDTDGAWTRVTYRFLETIPAMAMTVRLANRTSDHMEIQAVTRLALLIRTSHAYTPRGQSSLREDTDGWDVIADFEAADTDSAAVFVVNVGTDPVRFEAVDRSDDELGSFTEARFSYEASLNPGDSIEIVQIIGSAARSEAQTLTAAARTEWRADVHRYEDRVGSYAIDSGFDLADSNLVRTARWSRALLQANRHHLDGRIVPMPCPAQYNFFFTHDLLLTDLGAVIFDVNRVREDLRYVHALAGGDSLLPHAYYWRDDGYKTEWANSDNWNHLWFIILVGSYLKHSGDQVTVDDIWPVVAHSARLILENEQDGLMYAERPDWWDIGHVYGARAYLTSLTIRALRAYGYLSVRLGREQEKAAGYLELARQMNERMIDLLWDEDSGYLFNMLEGTTPDRHYYSGSLLSVAFGQLGQERSERLLGTARAELLDENIGIRNAMPPDFHTLVSTYRFLPGDVGDPYRYMNGGVWPQGIAWYGLALLEADRPEDALDVLRRFLSLDGILNSPNGQPAFFEYRDADPSLPSYGRIDKTTFLWAGGWYLNLLYGLAGARENEWNLYFDPRLPSELGDVSYDLMLRGEMARVRWSGVGAHLRRIMVDGRRAYSAVVTSRASEILLERGVPGTPYVAAATTVVSDAMYDDSTGELRVVLQTLPGQRVGLDIVGPVPIVHSSIEGFDSRVEPSVVSTVTDVASAEVRFVSSGSRAEVVLRFARPSRRLRVE
jgi:hypothetical protein